jgi:hypothetical protein
VADFDALNPYAPPLHTAEPVAGRLGRAHFDGKLLTFDKDGSLPDVCLKCGAMPPIVRRKQMFSYAPPWVLISFLVCTLGGIIAMAIYTKRATLQLPLCPSCNQRWRSAKTAIIVSLLALVATPLLAFAEPVHNMPGGGTIILTVFVLTFIAFIAIAVAYARPRMLQAKKIDKIAITLGGVDPRAAEAVVASARMVV